MLCIWQLSINSVKQKVIRSVNGVPTHATRKYQTTRTFHNRQDLCIKQMQYTEDLVIENDLGERKRLDLKATTFSEVDRIEMEWLGKYFDMISDEKEIPIVRQTSKQKRAVTQLKVGYWVSLVLVCMAVVPIMNVLFHFPSAWMEQNPFFIIDFLYYVLRLGCACAIGLALFAIYERFSLYYKRRKSGLPMKTLRMEYT